MNVNIEFTNLATTDETYMVRRQRLKIKPLVIFRAGQVG